MTPRLSLRELPTEGRPKPLGGVSDTPSDTGGRQEDGSWPLS